MKSKLREDKTSVKVLLLLFIATLIVVILSILQSRHVNQSSQWVLHSQKVMFGAERIMSHALDLETGARGYALTGDKLFLEPFYKSEKEVFEHLALLRSLIKNDPLQVRRVDSLDFYIDERIQRSNSIIKVRTESGIDAAIKITQTGGGKEITDRIRTIINEFQQTETKILEEREKSSNRNIVFQKLVLFTLLVFAFSMMAFFIRKIRIDYALRKLTVDKISSLNQNLETKVKERTEELSISKKTLEDTFPRITDAFIALDKNWNYTYANERICEMVNKNLDELIGKNVWEVFPDAVGSATYKCFHQALEKQEYIMHEDYYEPLDLWQENHIYPSPEGISVFIKDISEKKRREKELAESNQRYEYVTKATSDAIWDWDIKNETVFWGDGFHSIFGYSLKSLGSNIGEWEKHVHPEDYAKVSATMNAAIEGTSKDWQDEYRYKKADGSYAYVIDKAIIIRDEKGHAVRMIGAVQDITERKKLEVLLNNATTLARIGGWEIDMATQKVYFSKITREIHEVADDFIPTVENGINFYKEGYNRETIARVIQEAITDGTVWDMEMEIVTAKGNEKWVRAMGEAEFVDGKCVRLFGSFQDIDKLKRAQLAFESSMEEKSMLLESIGESFFAVDKNWIVTYWNRHAEAMMSIPRTEIVGKNFWEQDPSRRERLSYAKLHEAAATRQVVEFEDFYEPMEKWFEVYIYPSPEGLSVFFKDITEKKKVAIQLLELNTQLEKNIQELAISNKELEQFAYVASHDLQEPLRMVTSFLTQLEKKYNTQLDEKGKQYIYFAVDGAKRMRQIILDLLEFSRVGKKEDKLEMVDLNETMDEILLLHSKQTAESDATIEVDKLPELLTYRSPIRQVFQNLISNSLKYKKKHVAPNIKVSCRETATDYEFIVADNGIGIDPQYAEKIFVIFQRLHNKDEYSGTGMGLAIAKKIIENMNGNIWVKSEEGKGSEFYFTIPKPLNTLP